MKWLLVLMLASGCRQLLGFEELQGSDANQSDGNAGDGPVSATCVTHDDCDGRACLPDGSCADEDDVAYVDENGSGVTCARMLPCGTVTDALGTGRTIVKLSGKVIETAAIVLDARYTFIAEPGSKLVRAEGEDGPVLEIKNVGVATIVDLEITNLINGSAGIELGGGALTLERGKIVGCLGRGIDVSSGTVAITHSIIATNVLGGIAMNNTKFAISNTLVAQNGNTTSTIGGIRALTSLPGSTLELVTIADNITDNPNSSHDGVNCSGSAFTAHSSILSNDALDPTCTFEHSLFNTGAIPSGNGNILGNAQFKSVGDPRNADAYRLKNGSAGIDQGISSLTTDLDGQLRPFGDASDMGADEFLPNN
jgi:hypothetical protein